jgi:hypothetical protein
MRLLIRSKPIYLHSKRGPPINTVNKLFFVVASAIGIALGVTVVAAVVWFFVGLALQSSQQYGEVNTLRSQLALLPVSGKLTNQTVHNHQTYGDGTTPVYVQREYHLASTPSYSTVESYYRTQLAKRGWQTDFMSIDPQTSTSGAELELVYRQAGKHSDTLYYHIDYFPGSSTSLATLNLSLESTTAGGFDPLL